MRRRFSQGIGWQYMVRTLTICMGVLCFFLMLFSGVQHIKQDNRQRWYFESLQKTLSPLLLDALRRDDAEQYQAIFRGAMEGQDLLGIRVFDSARPHWLQSALSPALSQLPELPSYRFFIHEQSEGSERRLSVELHARPDLFQDRDGEYLAVLLSLAGTCFILLIAALSLHVRSTLVRPIHELQEKFAALQVTQLLEDGPLIATRQELLNEFDDLENSFLQILQRVQIAHREALSARNGLDFLNKNMAIELQMRQKKLEDELARSLNDNKLAALAEMASGIAHEINNPLAILVARTSQLRDLIADRPDQGSQIQTIVDSMDNKIFRIQESITDLETIASHPSFEEIKPLKIHRVLQRLSDLATHRFGTKGLRISLELQIEAEVQAREVELTQALLYLIENATEAALRQDKPWIVIQLVPEGEDSVIIRITDSGPGVEAAIREKIFQPFFTTKEVGKGRGIGLSLAQSIVQGNKGQLSFDFTAAHTTLNVRLPRNKSASQAA